jgi:hypothetical protein
MRLSSFDVNTTKGMLLALMVPSFGMLNCHTLSSSSKASNAWFTLSSSSMSKTHGFSHCSARRRGPALKNCKLCNSTCRDSQSTLLELDFNSTQSLCSGSSNFPIAFSSLMPGGARPWYQQPPRLRMPIASARCPLALRAVAASATLRLSTTVVVAIESAMYPLARSRCASCSKDENMLHSSPETILVIMSGEEIKSNWNFGQIRGGRGSQNGFGSLR